MVILKQIPVEQMTKDERLAAQNECQVLKLLHHPHIIEYYENFLEDKALMIAMEYAPGKGACLLASNGSRGGLPIKGSNAWSNRKMPMGGTRHLLALKWKHVLPAIGLNPGSNGQIPRGTTGHLLVLKGSFACQRVGPWVQWAGINGQDWAPPGLKMEG